MEVLYNTSNWKEEAVVATIGFFDGVHSGHRFLLQEMRQLAESRKLPAAVITFPVHPKVVLRPKYQSFFLNSFDEKLKLLSETAIDYVIVMDFTPELARLTAREFIATVLVPSWHIQTLLVGYNHRFGFQRFGKTEQYVLDGKALGVEVIKTSSYSSGNGTIVSSSEIRRQVELGNMAFVSHLLGYHYQLKGHVIEGNQIGRRLGFPTANIAVDEKCKVIPRNGSYAVRVAIDDKKYDGMLYVGSRPTVGKNDLISIEVNLFDFSEDIYNKPISVEFVALIREERKLDSLDELCKHLQEDKLKAIDVLRFITKL